MQILAKRRTRITNISPLKDCSIKSVSRAITDELGSIPSQCSSRQRFIPFIRERDAIGRLILPSFLPEIKSSKPRKTKNSLLKFEIKPRRLIKNNYKGDIPPIGAYEVQTSWIKKSFSHKNLVVCSPIAPNSAVQNTPTPKKSLSLVKSKSSASLNRKNKSVEPRKKVVWDELPIFSTPEQITAILSFAQEKREILGLQDGITKSLKKLKQSYFL